MKKLFVILFCLLFIGAAAAGGGLYIFLSSPANSAASEVLFEVKPGSSFTKISYDLHKQNIIKNPKLFSIYGRLSGASTALHVGEFKLSGSMSPKEILQTLSEGKSVIHLVTFPEGYNIYEMTQVIEGKWPERAQDFMQQAKSSSYVKELLNVEAQSFEGYLFPDTYAVTKYTTMKELIAMMVKRFQAAYEEVAAQSNKLRMNQHDHVTFASVVEKETGAPEERPMISSVFHNRLRRGMKLQSDPTIIYGHWVKTGEYLKNIRKKHILAKTAHNTYSVKALPVGPVSNPGKESLAAALNPVESEYIFFVSRNDGTHVFSKTLKEHNAAVRKFQLNPNARKGKSWRDLKKKRNK